MQESNRLSYLFRRYFDKEYTAEEREELMQHIRVAAHDEQLQELIMKTWEKSIPSYEQDEKKADEIFNFIISQPAQQPARVVRFKTWMRVAAAAAILFLIGLPLYFIISQRAGEQTNLAGLNTAAKADISPAKERATLTLSDGRTILLDSIANGMISQQGQTAVNKNGAELSYDTKSVATDESSMQMAYNSVSTPRGGQYHIVLPDGSKVWLNAASSIRFPIAFNGDERRVEVKGEAYFEVAKNPAKPFRVMIDPQQDGAARGEVEVLGTHFNINAYNNEPMIRTTLLEGSVKVSAQKETARIAKFLKPGQQAAINPEYAEHIRIIQDADIEEAMSWRNNQFIFEKADLQTIMRQLERWYDVDVVLQGDIKNKDFSCIVSRKANISEFLKMLELTGTVHFKIEGKTIIAMP